MKRERKIAKINGKYRGIITSRPIIYEIGVQNIEVSLQTGLKYVGLITGIEKI